MLKYIFIFVLFFTQITIANKHLYVSKKTPIELVPKYNVDYTITFKGKYIVQAAFSPAFQEVMPKVINEQGANFYLKLKNKLYKFNESTRTIRKSTFFAEIEKDQLITYSTQLKIGKTRVEYTLYSQNHYDDKITVNFSLEYDTNKYSFDEMPDKEKDIMINYLENQNMKILIY